MEITTKQKADGWQLVKFGDVAREVTASTRDPLGERIERYVGLEHIDPESLRLARYGLIAEDNPTFTKKFSAGDILFGRRRAYLKKAAVADFDGICSGDITVIAPKGDALVPGLLPFIVQSDSFFDWAVKHSAGGLSPRTKFKSLAEFEFLLLPRTRQEEIINVLSKFTIALQCNSNAIMSVEKLIKKIIFECFAEGKSQPQILLGNEQFFKVESGGTPSSSKKEYWNGGINWITLADLPAENLYTEIHKSERTITELGATHSSAKLLPINTVLVSTRATIGRIAIAKSETCTNQGYKNIIIKDHSVFLPIYIVMILIAQQRRLEAISAGGTFNDISKKNFCQLKIPHLDIKRQELFVSTFLTLRQQRQSLIENQKYLLNTSKKYIQTVLEAVE